MKSVSRRRHALDAFLFLFSYILAILWPKRDSRSCLRRRRLKIYMVPKSGAADWLERLGETP